MHITSGLPAEVTMEADSMWIEGGLKSTGHDFRKEGPALAQRTFGNETVMLGGWIQQAQSKLRYGIWTC